MVYGASTGYGMPSALDVTCHAGRCVPGGLGATCRTEALRGLSAATLLTLSSVTHATTVCASLAFRGRRCVGAT